jgi:outer membrane receptor protein involved in Fe transport
VNVYSGLYSQPQNRAATWYTDLPLISGVNLLHSRKKGNWDIVVGGNFNYDHGYIGPGATDSLVWEDTITNFSAKQMVSQRGRINFNLARKSVRYKGLTVGINGNGMLAASNMVFAWLNDTSGIYRAYPGAAFLQKQVIFNLDPYAVYVKNGNKHALRTRLLRTVNDITANQGNQSTVFYGDYQFQTKLKQLFNIDFIGGISSQHTYSYASIYSGSGHPSNTMLNVSAYAQLERKLIEKLTLSAGGRLEYFNLNNSVEKWKPIFRAGANYKLFQATFLRASYGQGYRFPTITERFIRTGVGNFGVFPNPNLKPESSWNAEIGIKQGFKIGPVMSYIDLAGFWQEYQNTIEYMFGIWRPLTTPEALASSAGFMFLNTGNSRVKGLDFSLAGTVKLSKTTDLTFLAGYNYILPTTLTPDYIYATDSLNRKFSYNTTSLNPDSKVLKYRFLHNAKMDVEFSRNKQLYIGFSAKYFSKIVNMDKIIKDFEVLTQGIDVLQDIRYMDYYYTHQHGIWVFDVRIGYQLNTKHKLSIVGSNILNTTYSLRPLKVEQPRVIMLQYTYKLGGN